MDNYFFSVRNLCAGYGGKVLVRGMEFGLARGEILTLIGPNGAGKSTVLKSIAGQLKLLGGNVYLGKDDLAQMKAGELARRISVVFTEKVRAEMKSCRDVVATGRYPYTGRFGVLSGADWRVVDETMELVRITDIAGQDFNRVSDGQRQRVMLARAICQETEIVILDEPTSYLDIRHKLEFMSALQKMREKKGLTVIMSLHELELAKLVSDKILCLKGGTVERFGTPAEVFEPALIERLFDIGEKDFAVDERLRAYIRRIGRYGETGEERKQGNDGQGDYGTGNDVGGGKESSCGGALPDPETGRIQGRAF